MPKYRPRRDVMKHEHALNDNHKFYFYPLCSKVEKSIGVFWLWLHSTMVSTWKFALDSTMEKAWKMVFVEWRNVNTDLVSLFVFNSISGTFYWRGKNHCNWHIPKANHTYIKFICCIYFLSMSLSSKRIKSAVLHVQMYNFDLPVSSIIFWTEKKSGIHYRNKAHMHIWIDFFTPLLLVINAFEFENNWKRCVAWTNLQRRPVTTGKKNQGFI